ncbi:phosphopantetheine-binding protein [Streptomyces monticola]|uniref:Phosphopantetheine-binding protein n=1 Tax=Streptomyces monticola TaxID=2666263 RepID=A0ABW2JBR7_9ACTN
MTPSTTSTATSTSTSPAAPAVTAAELERLTVAWAAEILDDPEAAPDDNFIDLGGHSILALRMCRYAQDRFGAEYDLMVLFESDLATAAAELAVRIGRDGSRDEPGDASGDGSGER